ncbi:MAG: carboxypeptidase regulatory-like domain-containing protein, partial [Gemmatimonadales bacterium]
LLLTLVAGACSRDGGETESRKPDADAVVAAGGIRGTVRDGFTDQPVSGAQISAGGFSVLTDDSGVYGVAPVSPGSLELAVYQRGFVQESITAIIESGVSTVIDFPLLPAEPPCCELGGLWTGEFVLDSAGLNVTPASRNVSGELVFDRLQADTSFGERVHQSRGRSRVEFQTLLGSDWSVLEAAEGLVFDGDSVAITVVPRFADWGVEMLGRMSADTVRGIWFQRASCCGAYGTFTLIRTAGSD